MDKKKNLSYTIGACAAGLTGANAAIISGAINTTLDANNSELFLDLDTGAFGETSAAVPGFDISFRFYSGTYIYNGPYADYGPYHAKAAVSSIADSPLNQTSLTESGGNSSSLDRFAYGDALVGGGNQSSNTEDSQGAGDWGGFTGIAYLAFSKVAVSDPLIGGEFQPGWIELDYQAGFPGGSIEVRSFAWGTAGEITNAGEGAVIPEPAHTAAFCALLAGGAAFYRKRRRN